MKSEELLIELKRGHINLPEDMVAAAIYVDAGEISHSALVIQFNGETKVFHFYGNILIEAAVDVMDEGRYVFIKKLDFVPNFLLPSFVAHCELIQKEAKPQYGFFYDPKSFYDKSGKYISPGTFPEYLTCVGFCLTVLQSYLSEEEYLKYEEWDHNTLDVHLERTAYQMLDIQRNNPDLTPEDIMQRVRRILPIEYFSAAYSERRPVSKTFTDGKSSVLRSQISSHIITD